MIIAALAVLGLILGSFVNALVWRLREQAELTDKSSKSALKQRRELSITRGHSMCPNCRHALAAKDLVPVLSWLWLKGRCRYCHRPISGQYPLVELLTGALFVAAYLLWPLGMHGVGLLQFVFCLVFIVFFVALAVYDLKWLELPDRLTYPLIGLAAVQTLAVAFWEHSVSLLWQPAVAGLIIFALFWALYQVSKGAWIGGGDVKLALALGLITASPLRAFLVVFFASLLGTLVSLPLLARGPKQLKARIPFGPYLLLATLVVQLYGTQVVDWYQRLFLSVY
jgi:leader peptidase (prepilin peptidase)/N-methyltransferase